MVIFSAWWWVGRVLAKTDGDEMFSLITERKMLSQRQEASPKP